MKKILFVILSMFSLPLFANNNNTNFTASSNIINSCKMTLSDMSFGELVAKQTPATALSDVNVFCNKNTALSQLVGKNKGDRIIY